MRETQQQFTKGLNQRLSPERGDTNRFVSLQNARLQKRGNTLEVARIEGFLRLNEIDNFTTVYDSVMYNQFLVVLWHDGTQAHVTFVNTTDGDDRTDFSWTTASVTSAEIILLDDTLFLVPFDRQVNLIEGTWYLNDFISTTPTISSLSQSGLSVAAEGQIVITGTPSSSPAVASTATVQFSVNGGTTSSPFTLEVAEIVGGTHTNTTSISSGSDAASIAAAVASLVNGDSSFAFTATNVGGGRIDFTHDTPGTGGNTLTVFFREQGGIDLTGTDVEVTPEPSLFSGGEAAKITGTLAGNVQIDIGSDTFTTGVNYDETPASVAAELQALINADADFVATVDGATINITAAATGESGNNAIILTPGSSEVTASISGMSGGGAGGGSIEQDEDYWYKARYVYYEGHSTKTSYPVHIKTDTSNGAVKITLALTQTDLDGNYPDVEIFRKRGTAEFNLIERFTPDAATFEFIDDGKPELELLTEETYIWAETSQGQAVVRDRLVRANNTYASVENSGEFAIDDDIATAVNTGDQGVPRNVTAEVFSEVRKSDGTTTLFKSHGTKRFTGEGRLQLRQTSIYEPSLDFKESGVYARFRPYTPPSTEVIPFNSVEIYNANVPSLATKDLAEAEQDKPASPHIFLGYKYVYVQQDAGADDIFIYDNAWDTGTPATSTTAPPANSIWEATNIDSIAFTQSINDFTPALDASGNNIGQALKYTRRTLRTDGVADQALFQLAFLEALQEGIRQGKVKVRLKAINNVTGLSTSRSDNEFINFEARVVGLLDTSITQTQFTETGTVVVPPLENKLYLVLESGTPFDDFDNLIANNDGVLGDYSTAPTDITHRYEFELIGLVADDTTTVTSQVVDNHTEYDYDYRLELTDYRDDDSDQAILLQRKTTNDVDGSLSAPAVQGWEKTLNNKFSFFTKNDWNINSTVITDSDIQSYQTNYPNQLIWSESYIRNSNVSKVRNFQFTNFKYIARDFGDIVHIEYILDKLFVFCDRGVNVINVGEVLTRQVGGQVAVDSSTLLNDDYWILKNLQQIKKNSIVQFENMLFFSDGFDVWVYDGQLRNINEGQVTFDDSQAFVAAIDPRNKEYLLTNGTQTFAYSMELDTWQGPYTYALKTASPYRNNFYGVVGTESVGFNNTNAFNSVSFSTIIESVFNTLEEASFVKLFRKFLVEVSPALSASADVTFSYKADGQVFDDNNLFDLPEKNGIYNVGVKAVHKNSRQISWKITTQKQGFVLSLLSFIWNLRRRR